MAISKEQQRELSKLARAANRRLERASEGQRRALDYYLRKYHTQTSESRGRVFKQGQAKTEAEYRARMRELEAFMYGDKERAAKDPNYKPISTRKAWEQLKKENVSKANEKLKNEGYDLTDEELATLFEEVGGAAAGKNFYRVLENVQAKKYNAGNSWNEDKLQEAINERATDLQITIELIKSRSKW